MNKPQSDFDPADDLGPLDEHGQQIWSAEQEAAIARMRADPDYLTAIAEAEADIAEGRTLSHEQMKVEFEAMRARWLRDRGL